MYKRKRAGNTITRKINSTKDTAAKADKNHYISNSYLEGFIPIDTEYFTASVLLTWDYKTQLLLPAQAGKESLSCCSPGESRSAASRSCEGRTFKTSWTGGGTGSNNQPQWMLDPCDRNHSYGPPFKRDRGNTKCSMMPPALRRSTSFAATPICAPVWTVWLH